MNPIATKPVFDGDHPSFYADKTRERWPRFGLGIAAPLKDRSELPKAVVNVLESNKLDRVNPIHRARLAVLADRRGPGRWRSDPYGIERFVPSPRSYQPITGPIEYRDVDAIETAMNAVVVAYGLPSQPEETIVDQTTEPTIEHRIGAAITELVASGLSVTIAGDPDTYVVARMEESRSGTLVVVRVGLSDRSDPTPITADRVQEAIEDSAAMSSRVYREPIRP